MNDLTKILFDYFKDNDIDPNKVANLIEDAKINVLDNLAALKALTRKKYSIQQPKHQILLERR